MKIKSAVLIGAGLAAGYIFGTAAGRARFEQIKNRADAIAHDPAVQQNVANLAGQVKNNADKIPGPVSGIIKAAASQVQSSLDHTPTGTD
jgi:hypothetical protein